MRHRCSCLQGAAFPRIVSPARFVAAKKKKKDREGMWKNMGQSLQNLLQNTAKGIPKDPGTAHWYYQMSFANMLFFVLQQIY